MNARRIADWLETHWVTPAYSGWLLSALSLFFFMSATNTLAGWLYVVSGISFALLAIAAVLPERTLRHIQIHRSPIQPVSAGDSLTIEVSVENLTHQAKALIQVQDLLPYGLGQPAVQAIETLSPHSSHSWTYHQPTQHRGIYRWQTVHLRTAAPLGLFWCRRSHTAKATAVVYPTVLPLLNCPLIDEMGRDASLQINHDRHAQAATEGLTRSLRPYRWGDPTRLVHWRTSARYGELRVRELEVLTGGQELILCLDTALRWNASATPESEFEQAVVAAASLYFYAKQQGLTVKLWTAGTGLVQGSQAVLETLAAVQSGEAQADRLPPAPIVWLTQNPTSLGALPLGSRWMLWTAGLLPSQLTTQLTDSAEPVARRPGIVINSRQPLQVQLQRSLASL